MIWGCFAASDLGQLAILKEKMYSQVYHGILSDNVSTLNVKVNVL